MAWTEHQMQLTSMSPSSHHPNWIRCREQQNWYCVLPQPLHIPRRAWAVLWENHRYCTACLLRVCIQWYEELDYAATIHGWWAQSACCKISVIVFIVQSVYLGPRPYLHNVTHFSQGLCLHPTVNFWCNLAASTKHKHEGNENVLFTDRFSSFSNWCCPLSNLIPGA